MSDWGADGAMNLKMGRQGPSEKTYRLCDSEEELWKERGRIPCALTAWLKLPFPAKPARHPGASPAVASSCWPDQKSKHDNHLI